MSKSFPLFSKTTSNLTPLTISPTFAGSPQSVFPPALTSSYKLPSPLPTIKSSKLNETVNGDLRIRVERQYRESCERGFLHLVGSLISYGENGDVVARGEELLAEVEPDDGMAPAVGIDDEDALPVDGGGGSFNGEGRATRERTIGATGGRGGG